MFNLYNCIYNTIVSSLSNSVKIYALIEKTIKFAHNIFNKFSYGNNIKVSDHNHWKHYEKRIKKVFSRLQRIRFSLLKYDINDEYLPGKYM